MKKERKNSTKANTFPNEAFDEVINSLFSSKRSLQIIHVPYRNQNSTTLNKKILKPHLKFGKKSYNKMGFSIKRNNS
jgi:hypothetical protein